MGCNTWLKGGGKPSLALCVEWRTATLGPRDWGSGSDAGVELCGFCYIYGCMVAYEMQKMHTGLWTSVIDT